MIYKAVFRIFLTGCRLFGALKILTVLLVTELTSIAKNCFTNSVFSTKNDLFPSRCLLLKSQVLLLTVSTKISDLTKNDFF